MATVIELRKMAHDLYESARASRNPFTKQKLRKAADDYLEEAERLRRFKAKTSWEITISGFSKLALASPYADDTSVVGSQSAARKSHSK
jgi:hypothetical protein